MGPDILGIVWLIIASVSAIVMIIIIRKFVNQERMAMIEKGMTPADFKTESSSRFGTLRFALLFIGAGIGLFLAYFLDTAFDMEEVAYFSMLFIFGGAGLGLAYLIESRKAEEGNGHER